MKKCLFSLVVFMCMTVLASAQSDSRNTNSRSVSNTSHVKHTSKVSKTKKASDTKTGVITNTSSSSTTPVINNRVEYMQNGQLATVTGHQATPVNSDEYQSGRGKKKKQNKDRTRY